MYRHLIIAIGRRYMKLDWGSDDNDDNSIGPFVVAGSCMSLFRAVAGKWVSPFLGMVPVFISAF